MGNSELNSVMIQRMIHKQSISSRGKSPISNDAIKRDSIFKDTGIKMKGPSMLNLNYVKGQSTLDQLTK